MDKISTAGIGSEKHSRLLTMIFSVFQLFFTAYISAQIIGTDAAEYRKSYGLSGYSDSAVMNGVKIFTAGIIICTVFAWIIIIASGMKSDGYFFRLEFLESIIYPYALCYCLSKTFLIRLAAMFLAFITDSNGEMISEGISEFNRGLISLTMFEIRWYTYPIVFVLLICMLKKITKGFKDLAVMLLLHPVLHFLIYRLCFAEIFFYRDY